MFSAHVKIAIFVTTAYCLLLAAAHILFNTNAKFNLKRLHHHNHGAMTHGFHTAVSYRIHSVFAVMVVIKIVDDLRISAERPIV